MGSRLLEAPYQRVASTADLQRFRGEPARPRPWGALVSPLGSNRYKRLNQDPPTGSLETLTGGFWAPVVTRKHLLEGAGLLNLNFPGTLYGEFMATSIRTT